MPTPSLAPAPTQPAPAATATATPVAPPAAIEHTVQAGDTLLSIALANGVSMAAIQLANDMGESQMVRLGEALKVPRTKISPDENTFWVVHIVQPGETLVGISAAYGALLDDLVRVNQLPDASMLRVSQAVILPVTGFVQPSQAVAQVEPQPAARSKPAALGNSAPDQPAPVAAEAAPTAVPLPTPDTAAAAPVEASQPLAAAAQAQTEVTGDADVIRQQLFDLHNQARVSAGLGPLAWSPVLQQAAQLHAQDSAVRGFGSHSGSDGSTSQLRIARAGYAGSVTGENWVFARSAERAFDMWFTQEFPSGPHRNNILSYRYAEVGFGVASAGNGGYYIIANFGAP